MPAPLLFALTMFVSATLLFLVQPMIGKMVTPLLGGTPAVWNTCMVFYQALLLGGYFYAHRATSDLPPKKQTTLHIVVMLAALGVLLLGALFSINNSPIPIAKSLSPQGDDYPFFGVIVLLTVAIGLPFFVVSTSAPLLQKWFAETGHPSAKDPYFLYAASNFGSLLALIAYPAVVEPYLRIIHQNWIWAIGYGTLVILVLACARAVRQGPPPRPSARTYPGVKFPASSDAGTSTLSRGSSTARSSAMGRTAAASHPSVKEQPGRAMTNDAVDVVDAEPTLLQKAHWLGLAFVPSSLMLGVTTFVSTDMASIPLLWIIPLSLYLITFIIVFSNAPKGLHLLMTLLMPVLVLLLVFLMTSKVTAQFGLQVLLHMATFFVVAMVCHGELAKTRPSSKHLTSFYLIMSMGGMLGGLFNALFAPIVFTFISEYPITLVLACFLLPNMFPDDEKKLGPWTIALDVILPSAIFFGCCILQSNHQQIAKFIYNNSLLMFLGLIAYGIPAIPAVLIFEKNTRSRIVLAILLGSSLFLYAVVGPLVDLLGTLEKPLWLGTSAQSLNADVCRWLAAVCPLAAYFWHWKRHGSKENLPRAMLIGAGSWAASFAFLLIAVNTTGSEAMRDMVKHAHISEKTVAQILIFGVPAMICYFFVERPIRFGAAVGALWLATFWTVYRKENDPAFLDHYYELAYKDRYKIEHYDRSFFGRTKIERDGQWLPIAAGIFPDDFSTEACEIVHRPFGQPGEEYIYIRSRGDRRPLYLIEKELVDGQLKSSYYVRREFLELVHGTTIHGLQEANKERTDIARALLPLGAANGLEAMMSTVGLAGEAIQFPGRDPLTYYHRTGPVGSMFNAFLGRNRTKENPNSDVACIGLGSGSLSSYGMPGQKMTFFEIDTHVRRLVEAPRYFTYIDSAKRQGVDIEFVMGDARVTLEGLQGRKFGFMLIDAFSSDAIPAHLLTKQSVELYFQRLEDDGLLAIHISNRYIDLEPIVERICRELHLECRVMHGSSDSSTGKYAATWIAVARTREALGAIAEDCDAWLAEEKKGSNSDRWMPLTADDKVGLWTDDFSPIIPVLKGEWKFWARD